MSEFAQAFVGVLLQMAPFLLLGFAVAGLLHAFVPRALLARAMGGQGAGAILRATLIGIPLPLCSCGVVPVVTELRRRGAGRGAATAFLVSTPETGVDSISASAAVMHPLLVVARPVAALLSALLAGLLVERFSAGPAPWPGTKDPACCDHAEDVAETQARGLRGGLRYAFGDLFDEVGTYLLPALLLSALLTSVVDPGGLARYFTSTWVQMLVLLVAGIPIYVCATAATPVAAALIAGGFSPGAALVFLLAGPATNLVTIAAAAQMLGRRGAMLYVAAVAIGALASGVALDALFAGFGIEPRAAATPAHEHHGVLAWTSAAVLSALIGRVYWRKVRGRR